MNINTKHPGRKRKHHISCYLDDKEYIAFRDKRSKTYYSQSEYIRKCVLDKKITVIRRLIKVEDIDGKIDDSFVYIRNKPKEIGKPPEDYRNVVVEGARDCGIEDDYIEKNLL